MALQKKPTTEDLELLMVLTDPILLTEFLNNTNFGDTNKNNWRRGEPFKLRPYQKEIITDKSRSIVVTGGRSIGKCQPESARIFTTEGYKSIRELKDLPYFTTYGVAKDYEIKQRRAVILPDKMKEIYTIKTASGNIISGTDVHPLLTKNGYYLMENIRPGMQVAIAKKLPTQHCVNETFEWYEARLIGYNILRKDGFISECKMYPRFEAIAEELRFIGKQMFCRVARMKSGLMYFKRQRGYFLHPVNYLKKQIGISFGKIPARFNLGFMKNQSLDLIRVMLEAMFAQAGILSRNSIKVDVPAKILAADLQELLLYFGIESRYENTELIIDNPASVYLFWNTFSLPGVAVNDLKLPQHDYDTISEYLKWDDVISVTIGGKQKTYSVHVYKDETYIANGVVNHNSVIIENLLTYQIINSADLFQETLEQLLATPNQNQLTPLLDKVIGKFNASPLLKDFLEAKNLSKGTFDFKATPGKQHRLYARIAGSKTENNIVNN